jgi:hypothetical protein
VSTGNTCRAKPVDVHHLLISARLSEQWQVT